MELVANRSVVEHELRRALASRRANQKNSVLLLRAAPTWRGELEFSFEDKDRQIAVTVAPCETVLAVLAALAGRRDGQYLVVLTPCDTLEVGDSVLALALHPEIKPVDRWDLVKDAFGAVRLDPVLAKKDNRWVAEALLDAQPAGGWRRLPGPVLSQASALNRLTATRLGIEDADDSPVDAAALLQWTADRAAVGSFLRLREEERAGLIAWLAETTGGVADVVFAMAVTGKIFDAIPFGLVVAALYGLPAHAQAAAPEPVGKTDEVVVARVRAEERYLGRTTPDIEALQAFGLASESLVTRWADNGHAIQAAALCERAEAILAELASTEDGRQILASRSSVLEAGLDARFTALADTLSAVLATLERGAPAQERLAAAEEALVAVRTHGRKRDRDTEIRAAADAVRLARWLAAPEGLPATLAESSTRMLCSWAWADRALASIARSDTGRVPALAHVYAALWERARSLRAELDTDFARKYAAWSEASSASDDLLLVENLLDRIARPIAELRLPVIVILDGMTAAAGIELAGELTGRGGWLEGGRHEDGREPVLATIPSITAISRTSLLTGALSSGDQAQEKSGFAAFWARRKSALFHKASLAPDPGHSLASQVRDAIASPDTVVAVVLNAIDDALDKGKQGPAHWTPDQVTYLRPVLDEARRSGRPVILTADHGHVLDRGEGASPAASESARYRSGTSGPGEITVRGPRVVVGGEIVAAVDEKIHYTPRRAGYHGGASLAEVVVPVIILLPSDSLLPVGWYAYDAAGHAPAWWDAPASRAAQPPAPGRALDSAKPAAQSRRRRAATVAPDGDALFDVTEAAPMLRQQAQPSVTLGDQVVASPRMASQRQGIPRAPAEADVAALIDALARAGGRLTLAEAATVTGQPAVRMSRYLAQVARLLNVDSYAVLNHSEASRLVELSLPLLRQQFLGE
jgi:PglZ domain